MLLPNFRSEFDRKAAKFLKNYVHYDLFSDQNKLELGRKYMVGRVTVNTLLFWPKIQCIIICPKTTGSYIYRH